MKAEACTNPSVEQLIENNLEWMHDQARRSVAYLGMEAHLAPEYYTCAFLALRSAAKGFDPEVGSDFQAYARKAIFNAVLDQACDEGKVKNPEKYGRRKKVREIWLDGLTEDESFGSSADDPAEMMFTDPKNEFTGSFDDLLALIPEKSRDIFRMRYQDGLRLADIAKRKRTTKQAIFNTIQRGLNAARKSFKVVPLSEASKPHFGFPARSA